MNITPIRQRFQVPALNMRIENDRVVLDFGQEIRRIGLTASDAERLGKSLLEASERIRDKKIIVPFGGA